MHEKHIQYPVCKLGGDGVEGVDEHSDDPLVAHCCADIYAVGHVVGVQARVEELDDGGYAEEGDGQIGGGNNEP